MRTRLPFSVLAGGAALAMTTLGLAVPFADDAQASVPASVAFSLGGPTSQGGLPILNGADLGPYAIGLDTEILVTITDTGTDAVSLPEAPLTEDQLPAFPTSSGEGLSTIAVTGLGAGWPTCSATVLQPGQFCAIGLSLLPLRVGPQTGAVTFGGSLPTFSFTVEGDEGYVIATSGAAAEYFDTYGASMGSDRQPSFVDQDERQLNAPVVSAAATQTGDGYYLAASDGGIFTFGDAKFYGSTGGIHLNQPVEGMASTPDGGGYWLEAHDAGSFAEGDAPYIQDGFSAPSFDTVTISPFGDPVVPGERLSNAAAASAKPAAVWHGVGVHTRV